jgi:hypothetical protein
MRGRRRRGGGTYHIIINPDNFLLFVCPYVGARVQWAAARIGADSNSSVDIALLFRGGFHLKH